MHRGEPGPRRGAGRAFLGYLAVSFVLYATQVMTRFPSRFVGQGSRDALLYVWDLAWWPHAILSRLNPFRPTVVFFPSGVNMAWVTGLPGPALAVYPLTRLLGPVFASNAVAVAAPALAAWAAFLLCREVTDRFGASLVGGYLFGFSTYMVGQMYGHMNLYLVFPVPLAAYLSVRYVQGRLSRRRFIWMLAAVLVAEFSISTEVFATMTFFGAITLGGAFAIVPSLRARWREVLEPIGLAYALAAVPLAPYLWYATQGLPPTLAGGTSGSAVDLLSFFVPRNGSLIGGPWFAPFTRAFRPNVSEDGAYLGPILLGVLAFVLAKDRRDRTTMLLFSFTALAALLSLGGSLDIHGARTIPLPWRAFRSVPILRDALPERFTMYMWLGIALIVARWLAAQRISREGLRLVPWAAVGAGALLLLPNVSLPDFHRPAEVPRFFADRQFERYLAPDDSILILHPPGADGKDSAQEMLWQASADFSFAMPQGYLGPEPAAFANDPVWQNMKTGQPFGVTANQLEGWLTAHDVGLVAVTGNGIASRWRPMLSLVTGSQPQPVGGVQLYRVSETTEA